VIHTTTRYPDCRATKKFLASKNLSQEGIDIEENPEAAETVMKHNDGIRKIPMLEVEETIVSGDRFYPSRFEKDMRAAGAL
jgi:glutaredoxin